MANGTAQARTGRSGGGIGAIEFREVVTTIIALGIVGTALYLLVATFTSAGTENVFRDNKDVMASGLGLLGAVLGYYFGRVPAEKRADAAEAATSEVQASMASTRGYVASQLVTTRGGGGVSTETRQALEEVMQHLGG